MEKEKSIMEEKHYTYWKRSQFEQLPRREWGEVIDGVTGFVILPLKSKHDSGYRHMEIVPIKDEKPLCRCGGCSDVLALGITYGYSRLGRLPDNLRIDCLPVSGLLHVFTYNHTMSIGIDISTLEILCNEVVK